MKASVVALVLLLSVATTCAYRHLVTYVDFDHILDYNPDTGKLRAFDFRRHLPKNDTCDVFVYPPLIEGSSLIDVVFTELDTAQARLSYVGSEMFLIQSPLTGSYMIRRCSGFMPQQTTIPCEVHAAGKSDFLKGSHRLFYASENRIIRHNADTQTLDLVFFDADVHGGGYPFSKPLVTGQLPMFSGEVEFAVVHIPQPKMKLLIVQEVATGAFKVFKFNPLADTLSGVVGEVVLSGTLVAGFHIKPLGEDAVIAYHELSGDFEIWRIVVDGDKLAIETIKRDTLETGHGCIHDDRQTCIAHEGCGWCADSTTCHQLASNRSACDGSPCRDMVDATSPDRKKFQTFEMPLPGMLREFGDAPANNPKSPLRNLSKNTAIPITRDSDLVHEEIEHGFQTNPSEGLVFMPPSDEHPDALRFMDTTGEIPVVFANLTTQESQMNVAEGKRPEEVLTSPSGELHEQRDPGFETLPVPPALRNITKHSFVSNPEPPVVPKEQWKVPEGVNHPDEKFIPHDATTIREDDLMNEVESAYSSLLPKGDNMKIVRPLDSVLAPEPSLTTANFQPKDTASKFTASAPPPETYVAPALYSTADMEAGIGHVVEPKVGSDTQWLAMENARYNSISILTPPATPPIETTLEHMHDTTGKDSAPDGFLKVKADSPIIEGTAVPDVPVELGQEEIGKAANGLLVASDRQDLGAKAAVAQPVVLEHSTEPIFVAPARKAATGTTSTTSSSSSSSSSSL